MPWGWRAGCPHTDWGVGRQIAGATDLILHSALCILFLLRFLFLRFLDLSTPIYFIASIGEIFSTIRLDFLLPRNTTVNENITAIPKASSIP